MNHKYSLFKDILKTFDGELDYNKEEHFHTIDSMSEHISTHSEYLVQFMFKIKREEVRHTRTYDKVTDVLAKVGGTLNIVLFILQLIIRKINFLDFQVELVNSILQGKANKKETIKRNSLNFFQKIKWLLSNCRIISYEKAEYYKRSFNDINRFYDIINISNAIAWVEVERGKDTDLSNTVFSKRNLEAKNLLSPPNERPAAPNLQSINKDKIIFSVKGEENGDIPVSDERKIEGGIEINCLVRKI